MRAALILAVVAWLANWPAWRLESWIGTEGRRVEIAREMAASGDWILPTLGLEPTLAKPPGFYWALAGLQRVFGLDEVAMRAPAVVAVWLVALLAYTLLRRSHGALAGWVAGLGILCSPAVIYEGALAEIDPLFAAATAASVLLLGRAVGYGGQWAFFAAGLCGAVALLSKGAPFVLFLLGPALVSVRRRLLPWRGYALFAVTAVVPFALYYALLAGHPGSSDLVAVAGEETVGRLFTYELWHVLDLPLHFVRALLIMMPLLLFVFAEFRGTHEAALQRREIQQRFCTGSALTFVLVLALFPGRSVRYMFPAVLLFNIGVAPAVVGFLEYPAPLGPMPRRVLRWLGVVGALSLCVLPFVRQPYPLPGASPWFGLSLAVTPLLVSTRRAVVALCFALPVIAAWTVLEDRRDRYEHGVLSSRDIATLIREVVDTRDARPLATRGHMTSSYLFELPELVPGDEQERRAPMAPWLLVEQNAGGLGRTPGYVDRVRIRARNRCVVLQQRAP